MWRIRRFIESVWNLIVWFPVIWKDKQWDSHYYEVILLKKIRLQRIYFEKRQFFVGWENEVKWMKYCEILLSRLINNVYWEDEWDGKVPSRRGFSDKYIKNPEYVNWVYSNSKISYADLWEDKTRALFWKIFVWRYERWWD